MKTSKSPKAVAIVAYATAKRSLPPYLHLKSPKKFTQHQLVACLVLKEFFTTDYRGIEEILKDSSDLQKILELEEIPHYTTLQKAAHRLTRKDTLDKLIKGILKVAVKTKILKKNVALSAIDGTGFESHHISAYFVKRKAKGQEIYQMTTYTTYPKVGIVVDSDTHLVLSGIPERGPYPDIVHFEKAIIEAEKNIHSKILTADAGYDSEKSHLFARERNIRTIIPPKVGRQTIKLPSGKWRKIMAIRFNQKLYGQRWQVETVNSMIKRNLGSFLRAKTYWSQCREMMLRLFTHNVMVVR
ncbi:MAG: transposase [Patescibacteria group bacterium]